jgi:AraC family transcriptional regulator of adaptative response/methylated-DNA-[protein]-cysteine methyltransferase
LVHEVCGLIDQCAEEPPSLAALAGRAGLSPHYLQRIFKRATGITPHQYAEAQRLAHLKARLLDGDDVTTALYAAGYGSSSRLYSQAPAQLGMTPATYRKGGIGMTISFTMAACPFGHVLVAGTERGICAVSLGDTPEELEAALRAEYPAAVIRRDDRDLRVWVDAVMQYLAGENVRLDLPLDVQATAFKWRVWQALRAIPYGTTRSYSQIAADIGQPSAVRAVARACATNPVALVVPCHRVVREDGQPGGYRWGIERKQSLLDQERVTASAREEAVV